MIEPKSVAPPTPIAVKSTISIFNIPYAKIGKVKRLPDKYLCVIRLGSHHKLGNYIEHLLMTAATAGRAFCCELNALERAEHVIEGRKIMKRILDIAVAYLHTVTNSVVFLHR